MNEEREREELGELPEDLMRERGEVIVGDKPPYDPRRVPADVDYQQEVEEKQKDVPGGSLSQGARVVSVYDTRPVNAEDFIFTQVREISITAPNGTPGLGVFGTWFFQIPEGLIGVLRSIKIEPEVDITPARFAQSGSLPVVPVDPNTPVFTYRVKDNGVAFKGYDNIGSDSISAILPTHVIGGSQDFISLEIANNATVNTDINNLRILVSFYGQLILSTGREKQYEIGEPKPTKPLIPQQPNIRQPKTQSSPVKPQRSRRSKPNRPDLRPSVVRPAGGRRRGRSAGVNMGRYR